MKDLEKLHTLQFDLIKLLLNKRGTLDDFKELRNNLISTNSLIEKKKNNIEVSPENIESIEDYVSCMRKGR